MKDAVILHNCTRFRQSSWELVGLLSVSYQVTFCDL